MASIITITSGKGGVGKTTTAINLGIALAGFGREVVIVDANLSTPNIGLHLGAPIVPISLNHVLCGEASISDAVYEHESGTKIVPSSLSIKLMKTVEGEKLKEVGKKLKRIADYVIYDSAAGLGEEAIAAMNAADELIIVTNPEIPAVTDALKTSKVINDLNKKIKGVIVTRLRNSKTEMPLKNIEEMLELPILGTIPEDKNIQAAIFAKNAILCTHPKSKASIAYKTIAAKILGINYKERVGFWSRLFNSF